MDGKDLLLGVACFTAFLVFAAPGFVMWWVRSFLRYAPYPYLFTALTSVLWSIYGADWSLLPLARLSALGTILGTIYVLLFLYNSDPADARLVYLFRWTVSGAVAVACAVGFDLIVPRTTVYGVLCCLASCAASAAPFYNLPRVCRERNMESMPSFWIPAIALPNGVLWTVRNTTLGDGKKIDYNLVLASGFAAFCALVQIIMHIKCWMQPPPPPTTTTDLEEPLIRNANPPPPPPVTTTIEETLIRSANPPPPPPPTTTTDLEEPLIRNANPPPPPPPTKTTTEEPLIRNTTVPPPPSLISNSTVKDVSQHPAPPPTTDLQDSLISNNTVKDVSHHAQPGDQQPDPAA